VRKAREPNDKLDCATDKTLAEADRKLVPMKQAGEIWRLMASNTFSFHQKTKCPKLTD